jgi:DNA-binding GntR family transcriptional regulator
MRKYILILLVALTAASCATLRAPAKLERFVNRVERNADRYRPYQWDRVNRQYEALLREYVDNYRMYSISEKQQAMAAIGRYHGILVDHGIKKGIGFLGSLGAYAGGLLDLLRQDAGAVEDFLQSVLGLGKRDLGNAMDSLRKQLAE